MKALAIALGVGMLAAPAYAQTTTMTFDTATPIADTETPGAWYVDRRAPATFATNFTDDTLTESISGAQQDPVTTPGIGFYNTQGRKYDLAAGTTSLSVDLYVSGDWVSGTSATQRKAGLWGTGVDASGNITAYPIIEFAYGGFEIYDSNTGQFTQIGTPANFNYGQFYTLNISLRGDEITYSVGNLTGSYDANGTTEFSNIMLQGYNYGDSYKIHWDNVVTSVGGAVPEPATWGMMILGFGAIGYVMRRRARRSIASAAIA